MRSSSLNEIPIRARFLLGAGMISSLERKITLSRKAIEQKKHNDAMFLVSLSQPI